jgi:hypothetical protein
MSRLRYVLPLLLLTLSLFAAENAATSTPQKTKRKAATRTTKQPAAPTAPAATADEVRQLRDALAAQQQHVQRLEQQLQLFESQFQRTETAATEAQSKVGEIQTSTSKQQDSLSKLQLDMNDFRTTMTAQSVATQEEQKRTSAVESLLGRLRWSGDVRVRQEDFFQSHDGCNGSCNPRIRERIRVRLNLEGRVNQDFVAGLSLASGAVTDPTSTNETLTNALERKTFSLDRGYITYNPQAYKWLTLTGGKFAYTWIRTNQTFDPDINPEGFSEKLSFNSKDQVLKNVTFTGMQILLNEINRPTSGATCAAGFCTNGGNNTGADSFAAGGQVSVKLQLGKRISMTPSYSVLNFRNENALLNNAVSGVAGAFAPNGLTNSTVTSAGVTRFLSRFLYSDLIVDTNVDTGWKRWPWRVVLEYLDNLNAADHPNVGTTPALALGRQSHLYRVETSFGQQKNQGDFLFGYSFHRQEQDSVIASFAESDQRAPTNILQHSLYAQYRVRPNVTLAGTLWVGRTLNSNLQNAVRAPGIAVGAVEPYLKRSQFDVIYSF